MVLIMSVVVGANLIASSILVGFILWNGRGGFR